MLEVIEIHDIPEFFKGLVERAEGAGIFQVEIDEGEFVEV